MISNNLGFQFPPSMVAMNRGPHIGLSWTLLSIYTFLFCVSVFSDSKCSGILSCDYVNFVNNVHLLDVTEYVIYMV